MKVVVSCFLAALMAAVQVSCATDDSAKRKREMKEKMLNSGSNESLPWNRPTRERDIATPFGLPMSH